MNEKPREDIQHEKAPQKDPTLKEKLKDDIGQEKSKLKDMKFKEKIDYIWEYYKIPIIAFVVIALITGSIIDSVFIHPAKKTYVHVAFYNNYISYEEEAVFGNLLTEDLVEDKENFQVYTSSFFMASEDQQVNMAIAQKFMAMISARELDLLVSDTSEFEAMCSEGYFMDLSLVLSDAEIEEYRDILIVGEDEEGSFYAAISLDGNPLFEKLGLYTEGQILSVIGSSDRLETSHDAIMYILK